MRVDPDAVAGLRLFDAGAVPSRVDLEVRLPHAPRPCPSFLLELLDRARLDDVPVPAHPSPPWSVRSARGENRTLMGLPPAAFKAAASAVPPPRPHSVRRASTPPCGRPACASPGTGPGRSSGPAP